MNNVNFLFDSLNYSIFTLPVQWQVLLSIYLSIYLSNLPNYLYIFVCLSVCMIVAPSVKPPFVMLTLCSTDKQKPVKSLK
jgi:hypothetical protein